MTDDFGCAVADFKLLQIAIIVLRSTLACLLAICALLVLSLKFLLLSSSGGASTFGSAQQSMEAVAGKKKRSSSSQYERQRLDVPELRPWGVPKYQVPAFADVSV